MTATRNCYARLAQLAFAAMLGGIVVSAARAQTTIVPSGGQTPEQMTADQTACANQATSQSGYNPSQPAPVTSPSNPAAGERIKGAARGAAIGGVREQTTDKDEREVEDASEAGAKAGAAAGGVKQRQGRRDTRKETAQQEAANSQKQAAYQQAFSACMAARGYTVQ